jgi:hypothetical protein
VAANLLASIPRLEEVSWMIANQQTSAVQLQANSSKQSLDVILGANILNVSIAYDRLICQGSSHEEAVRHLRQQDRQYNPSVVDSLEQLVPVNDAQEIRVCPVAELRAGMILREEVRTHGGLLVVAKGQEISTALLLRLRNFFERKQISGDVRVLVPYQTTSAVH